MRRFRPTSAALSGRRFQTVLGQFPEKGQPDLDTKKLLADREKYLHASVNTFVTPRGVYEEPTFFVRAEMQYMYDHKGYKYLDLHGHNLAISVGHAHPKVTGAAIDQMQRMPHCSSMYYHEAPGLLAKELVDRLPPHPTGEDWVCYFVNSGSEAVDMAVQMSRAFTSNQRTLSLHKAYHGMVGYAAAATCIPKAEQGQYAAMYSGCSYVAPNSVSELEGFFGHVSSGSIACSIMEPLQGYGGVFPLDKGYLKTVFDLTRKHGGLAISDEVQTGFWRSGESYWGFDMEENKGAIPDIICAAKGLGSGVGVLGAVMCRRDIAEAFAKKMWFTTFGCNPVQTAAARAVLQVMDAPIGGDASNAHLTMRENTTEQGRRFYAKLGKLCEDMPELFRECRGTKNGLFLALEIAGATHEESLKNAYVMHQALRPYGTVCGRGSAVGNCFRIQPPMCLTSEDVDHVVNSIEEVGRTYKKQKGL